MSFIQAKVKNTRDLVMLDKSTSQAVVKGEILANNAAGAVVPATSGTVRASIEGICNQTIAAAEALGQVPAIAIAEGDTFIADLTNNSNAAHNYQRMVLTDSLTVNNTGSDSASGVVEQVEPYGATGDKKAIVRFV